MNQPRTIAVFGSSGVTQESELAQQAEELGRRLAQHGYRISNGGYMGVMEACSRGAQWAGGEVIGVTCQAFDERSPNPYLSKEVNTPDLNERITTLMRLSDGYIVLDGMIGTMAELFLAWNLIFMGEQKPLIVVGDALRRFIENLHQYTEINPRHIEYLRFAQDIDEAMKLLEDFDRRYWQN